MKSPLTYERLVQGEISQSLTPEDHRHLEQLEEDNRQFFQKHPHLASKKTSGTFSRIRIPGGVAAALLVGVALLPFLRPAEGDSRIKSGPLALLVYHQTGDGSELLGSEARLGSGDVVQLALFSAARSFGAIYSVDGRGTVTIHYPLNSPQAMLLETPKPRLLPYSYRLDDAPDQETFFLITNDHPFAVDLLRPFVQAYVTEQETQILLPDGFLSVSFRISKKESLP